MKLTPPSKIAFWVSIALAVVGVIASLFPVPMITDVVAFWLVVAGFVLLVAALLFKKL